VNTVAAASPWRSIVGPPSLPYAIDLPSMEGEHSAEDITVRTIAMDADATSGPAAQAAAAPGAHPDAVPGGQATVDHLPQPPLENRSNDATALARVCPLFIIMAQEQDTHNVGVLISGCQTDETSADATTADDMSYSALSNAIQIILAGNGKKRGAAAVTNRQLVDRARELLSKQPSRGTRSSSALLQR